MAFVLLQRGSELDPATLAARHRGMLAVLAAQAVALAAWALATGASVGHMLVEVVPLALAFAERSLIAYAGIPLVDADDNVLGVLCAIDTKPRRWSDEDVVTLRRLAERAVSELVARVA